MDSLSWLQVCGEGQTEGCIPTIQVIYLIAVIVGVVLVAIVGRRSRDLSTTTLSLMPVAIAINIAVGAIAVALRVPIYLDSIGTVLVGVLAGPWAGALTGLLSNLIWSILPVPGGAGPTIAFFAPVAGVIGLMAGFWASQGVFRLRTDDERVGRFLALAAGIGAAAIAMLVIQQTIGLTFDFEDLGSQTRFVTLGLIIVAIGVVVAWLTGRSVFAFEANDPRIQPYLSAATAISAFALLFALLRLLFAPNGYFSGIDGLTDDGAPDDFLGGANLTSLAMSDPLGLIVVLVVGGRGRVPDLDLGPARRQRPAVPGVGRRHHHGHHGRRDLGADRRGRVRWRHGSRDRHPRVGLPRARAGRVPVGLRAGPDERPARQDHQLHDRLLHPRGAPDHGSHDVQPRRGSSQRVMPAAHASAG